MPLYMDLHRGLKGISCKDVEHAHHLDEQVQDKHGVKYHKFWLNEETGTVFCLIEGPNKEACAAVHQEAHGLVACEIIEVNPSDYAALLGNDLPTPTGLSVHPDGKLDAATRTFLFTDIVNSTILTEEYGDLIAMTILRKHNEIVRRNLQLHSGTEVKHTGDGIMAVFKTSSKAIRSALQIQHELSEFRHAAPNTPLHIRIGINAGEPVTEGGDFFGVAVQLAKRICDLAHPGQVLVSDIVKGLSMGRNFQFRELEAQNLKGFSQPVKTFLVHA